MRLQFSVGVPRRIKILIYLIDFTYYYKNIRINTSKNTLKIKNL